MCTVHMQQITIFITLSPPDIVGKCTVFVRLSGQILITTISHNGLNNFDKT